MVDLVVMLAYILAIWIIMYLVKREVKRNKNNLVETQNFSVEIKRLPNLDKDYPLEYLKSDLWEHVQKIIGKEKQ